MAGCWATLSRTALPVGASFSGDCALTGLEWVCFIGPGPAARDTVAMAPLDSEQVDKKRAQQRARYHKRRADAALRKQDNQKKTARMVARYAVDEEYRERRRAQRRAYHQRWKRAKEQKLAVLLDRCGMHEDEHIDTPCEDLPSLATAQ